MATFAQTKPLKDEIALLLVLVVVVVVVVRAFTLQVVPLNGARSIGKWTCTLTFTGLVMAFRVFAPYGIREVFP